MEFKKNPENNVEKNNKGITNLYPKLGAFKDIAVKYIEAGITA